MSSIETVRARIVYNSRGEETIEIEVIADGVIGRAAAPTGASVGRFEASAYPVGGPPEALRAVEALASRLKGFKPSDISGLTRILTEFDGTQNFSKIGGSVAYAVSLAAAEAASRALGEPLYRFLGSEPYELPIPLGNVLGGGKHAGRGSTDIQEILAVPVGAPDITAALRANALTHRLLGKRLQEMDAHFSGGRGDEGAWITRLDNWRAFEVAYAAAEEASSIIGFRVALGIDLAASSLWRPREEVYEYARDGKRRDEADQIQFALDVVEAFSLVYLEDPLHEEAFQGFADLKGRIKGCLVCGDDLTATNIRRLKRAAEAEACDAVIMKVNQVGPLGEALAFASFARSIGLSVVASHRSGDTPDSHLSHVAVATHSKAIKAGVVGGERVAKLNELMKIAEGTGDRLPPLGI